MTYYNNITVLQIKNMKHAIGFDKNRVTGTKNRIMHCYRNHFCAEKENKSWQDLVSQDLAKIRKPNDNGFVNFYVTDEGFKFLADLLGFKKIYEID